MKYNRLFGIIYLLLENDTMTSKEFADYFEVSVRTIYRDIEVLCSLGIPLYMVKGRGGGIKILDNYKFDKAMFTDEEQKEILFSLEGINKLQIDNKEIYNKLRSVFGNNAENWFEVDFSVWNNSDIHKNNFQLIKQSIINKKVLEFDYFNSYGENTKRKVEPLKLYFKFNSWYLWSYDQNKEDMRMFKLMRMKNLRVLDITFKRVLSIEPKQDDKLPQLVNIILEIDKSLSYRVFDEFAENTIEILSNGNFRIKVEFPFNDWVYGYILSFGDKVKVIEPEYIKEEIISRLKKSLDNYELEIM